MTNEHDVNHFGYMDKLILRSFILCVLMLTVMAPASMAGEAPVDLRSAGNYAALAGTTLTNVVSVGTIVTGDIGISPGTELTGFPPGVVVGTLHVGDVPAALAQADLSTAYNDAAGRTTAPITVSGNLGGMTLFPGLYKSTSSLEISSGDLTLDAQGDPTAVFIFQMASTFTVTTGRKMILSGGANAANIFWQVGSSATFGTGSVIKGNILAAVSISFNTGASLDGRALAKAAVTFDSNIVTKPLQIELPTPTPETPTVTPESPTATPVAPTPTPESPTATPESPTATPVAPISTPTQIPVPPTVTPIVLINTPTPGAPTVTPVVPTTTPGSPTVTPAAPTTTPVAPTATPVGPTNTPTSTPVSPTTTPGAPTVTPVAATSTPTRTPVSPTTTPGAPTVTPVAATSTPTRTPVSPVATPTMTPTPILIVISPDTGLLQLSYRGLLVERGSQTGRSLEVSEFYDTEPIDLELIGSSIVVTNINGEISPAGFAMQSSGGSDLVVGSVIDMEPLVSDDDVLQGYLILDRMGNVHTYGSAQFLGDTEYIRTIRFGSLNYTQALGNALDLEVAPNPSGGNFGYYIISREGAVDGFGSVTDLPSLDTLVFGSPEAFDLLFDAIGNVNGYRVLTEFGQIIQWTADSGFTVVQSEVHRSSNGDPIPVDFVEIGGAYYIINERGELFGSNAVSSPKSLLGIIGDRGFFDLEVSD